MWICSFSTHLFSNLKPCTLTFYFSMFLYWARMDS